MRKYLQSHIYCIRTPGPVTPSSWRGLIPWWGELLPLLRSSSEIMEIVASAFPYTKPSFFFFFESIYIPGFQTLGPDRSRYKVSYHSYEKEAYVKAPRKVRKQENRVI